MAEQLLLKRVRRTSRLAVPTVTKANGPESDLNDLLQLIANKEAEREAIDLEVKDAQTKIEALLKSNKMKGFTDGVWEAQLVRTVSKTNRTIDPVKLFNMKNIKREEFFKLIKVSATSLKGLMTDREIDAISTIEPGQVTGTKLEVKRAKPTK